MSVGCEITGRPTVWPTLVNAKLRRVERTAPPRWEPMMRYRNRIDAGRELARHLTHYAGRSDVVVLGLPRGGVPVAAQVAAGLSATLDVFLVRKLGVPGHPELAMGAIAEGGIKVLNHRMIRDLRIPAGLVEHVSARERLKLDRHDVRFHSGRERLSLTGQTVILVDDGLATGATMEAAIMALREQRPSRVIVAAPVGDRVACSRLRLLADGVVCPRTPDPFSAVGRWYDDFEPTSEDEVHRLLTGSSGLEQHCGAAFIAATRAPSPADQ